MTTSVRKRQHELSIVRDTVESVWVAIILAFVLRAFMVEAFVIPTGSMAPRLMGEHYDLVCPACGYEYSYRWRSEGSVTRRDRISPRGAKCPLCTYRFDKSNQTAYVNGGDRVLVMKYLYRFVEPKPFDVIVFRNPQSNANNYIKRLIGLPGEQIEIVHGDVFVTPPKDKDKPKHEPKPEIRRKPDRAQEVMWQIICDNDYQPDPTKLKEHMKIDAPRRWALPNEGDETRSIPWEKTGNGRTFVFKGSGECSYLTFKGARNVVEYPDPDDPDRSRREAENESMWEAFVPRYGYNSGQRENHYLNTENDLCGDLKLSAVIRPRRMKETAECRLEMDGLWFSVRAVFDTDGGVTVYRKPREKDDRSGSLQRTDSNGWEEWARAETAAIVAPAGCKVELAHVDYSIKVWVDGEKVIDKDYPVALDELKKRLNDADTTLPRPGAGIGVRGGRLELTHLKLMRDVYYTNFSLGQPDGASPDFLMDYARAQGITTTTDNLGWGVAGNPIKLRKADEAKGQDPDLDEFYVLGDNSPQSLDSRGWIEAAPSLRLLDRDGERQYKLGTVPRYNMIGKAMFVYWPSGFRLPLLPGLPIVPDVGRMRLIR